MPFLGLVCLLGHCSNGFLALGDQDGLQPIWTRDGTRAPSMVLVPVDAQAPRCVDVGGIIAATSELTTRGASRGSAVRA